MIETNLADRAGSTFTTTTTTSTTTSTTITTYNLLDDACNHCSIPIFQVAVWNFPCKPVLVSDAGQDSA